MKGVDMKYKTLEEAFKAGYEKGWNAGYDAGLETNELMEIPD